MKRFLFIPGLPRCATTSFTQIFGQHPQLFLPKIKEPHFFLPNAERYFMFNRKGEKVAFKESGFVNNENEFNDNYDSFRNGKIYIDGSTLYAVHTESFQNIYEWNDIDPFFIILTRAPFKRAVSHYLYSLSRGEEFRAFDKALDDEVNGIYPDWLLKGYLAGSNSIPCEEKIKELWGPSRLISINIDADNIFNQDFMNQIITYFKLDAFTFNFDQTANALTYSNNPVVREIRILMKRVRQLNPILIDNKVTRMLFNNFMKSISTDKDIYKQYSQYEDLFNQYFNKSIAK